MKTPRFAVTRLLILAAACCVWAVGLTARAASPDVSNVQAAQRATSKKVDIYYDVSSASNQVTVAVTVSSDGGSTYAVPVSSLSGAVGPGVLVGTNKHIVWDAGTDWPGEYSTECKVRVWALSAVPDGMVFIPAGKFQMGNNYSTVEGDSDELPVHSVQLDAFYMDKYEVTDLLWSSVAAWTTGSGYGYDLSAGGGNSDRAKSRVTWYDAVKWCNARSEKEGLTPVYYTDSAFTSVYRSGETNPEVNWEASGYRLPTEAEWEKAARGGREGHHYPWHSYGGRWDSHISDNEANYDFAWPVNYVGSYDSNGYGLYDMAGNVQEWCWDRYIADYYSNAHATDDNPRGPTSGSERVLRGGTWTNGGGHLRCAARSHDYPTSELEISDVYGDRGFRCVRGL